MKKLGYALIAIGFLGGAFETVRQVEGVSVPAFLAWLAVGAVGVFVARLAGRREATDEVRLTANLETLVDSLGRVVGEVDRLEAEKSRFNVYDLRHRIDERCRDALADFAAARESIAHSFGLQAYSEVMNRFAAGERYLNRVWSASTDGYVDEAHAYIARAAEQFRDAHATFDQVRAAPSRWGAGRSF